MHSCGGGLTESLFDVDEGVKSKTHNTQNVSVFGRMCHFYSSVFPYCSQTNDLKSPCKVKNVPKTKVGG